EQTVAIPVYRIQEVLPRVYLNPIPDSPEYVAGNLQWRGSSVPVIDPAARWGEAPLAVRLEDRILVLALDDRLRAILWTEVDDLVKIGKRDLTSIPEEIPAAPYALAFWYTAQENVILLDPDSLMDSAELGKYAIP